MPFRRRYTPAGKRRYRRSSTVYVRKPKSLAKKAYSLAKKVNYKVNKEELKYVDTTVSGANMDNTGLVQHLTSISESTNPTGRIGRKVCLRSIYFKYSQIYLGEAQALTRVLIINWKDNRNGVAPSPLDVLQTVAPTADRNIQTAKSFNVLYDKVHNLIADQSNKQVYRKVFKRLRSTVQWDGPGASSDLTYGHLFILFLSDHGTVDFPQITYSVRVRYVDA